MNNLDYQLLKIFKPHLSKRRTFWMFIAKWEKEYPHITRVIDDYYSNSCGCTDWMVCWDAFTGYICKWCWKHDVHSNTGVPLYCDDCGKKLNKCVFCWEYLEFLWHYPTHIDICLLIEKITPFKWEIKHWFMFFYDYKSSERCSICEWSIDPKISFKLDLETQPIEYNDDDKKNLLIFLKKYL